jgi:iron(II)-dependent oxidoreductase
MDERPPPPGDERPRPTGVHFSHVTTQRYLPTPGRAPGWPFAEIGHWAIDIDAAAADWLEGIRQWRREHLTRLGWNDENYRRPELAWCQRNFVTVQAMVEDRYLFDAQAGRWTVERYLDDLERRWGGIDSVLLWYVYPNIGLDERNQFDLARDLPGGLQGLAGAIADFHRRGVRVLLPTMPWDQGTRDPGQPHWEAAAELVRAVGADGLNGDTYNGMPRAFFDACLARGVVPALQPESTLSAEDSLAWNVISWGKKVPREVQPAVSKWKWLEPRHMVQIENRWSRERLHDLQHAFFNGIGYNAWENVWGLWNGLSERDAEALRRVAAISRHCGRLLTSADWQPYAPTLQRGVFASRFPVDGLVLHTLVNRHEYPMDGEQLRLPHAPGRRHFDLWHGVELEPAVDGGDAVLAFGIEGHGFGAVLSQDAGATGEEVDRLQGLLDAQHARGARPLSSYPAAWRALPQRQAAIARTAARAQAPEGMVTVAGGRFDFAVHGVAIEGQTWEGADVQYPWESSPRRHHRHRLQVPRFHIDRTPVTNAQFEAFVRDSGYLPGDRHNFLRHWRDGAPPAGWRDKPVTWVAREDACAYAAWAGKRLPHEWEWQLAAQGHDGRPYPWGDALDADALPPRQHARCAPVPADVMAHPRGASPYGVLDLVGNVWQMTDVYEDEHTRSLVLRGGSLWAPLTSHWYFPPALRLDQHGKQLLMAPGRDRSGMVGFRCVVDAVDAAAMEDA